MAFRNAGAKLLLRSRSPTITNTIPRVFLSHPLRSISNSKNACKNFGDRIAKKLQRTIQFTANTTRKSTVNLSKKYFGPAEPPELYAAAGYKFLSGAALAGFSALCYYGVRRTGSPSARSRYPGWPDYVASRIKATFGYFGLSSLMTAMTTASLFRSRKFLMMLHARPWTVFASSVTTQVITGVTLLNVDYHRGRFHLRKLIVWAIHSGIMGVTIAPMCFVGGPLIIKAFMCTGSIIGFLSALAFCAPEKTFLKWSMPLGVGLGVIFGASLGSFLFPHTTRIGISLYSAYLHGGTFLFSLMMLQDCQSILLQAEELPFDENQDDTYDPINAAISLYMDALNVFVRIIQLFAFQEFAKKIK